MKSLILLSALAAVALASSSYDQKKPYNSQANQANYQQQQGRGQVGKPVTLPARIPGRQQNYGNGGSGISQQQFGNQQQPYGNSGINGGRGSSGQQNGAGFNRGTLTKPVYPQQQTGFINQNRPAGGQNKPLVPPNNGYGAFNQQQQQRPGAHGAPQKTGYNGRR